MNSVFGLPKNTISHHLLPFFTIEETVVKRAKRIQLKSNLEDYKRDENNEGDKNTDYCQYLFGKVGHIMACLACDTFGTFVACDIFGTFICLA